MNKLKESFDRGFKTLEQAVKADPGQETSAAENFHEFDEKEQVRQRLRQCLERNTGSLMERLQMDAVERDRWLDMVMLLLMELYRFMERRSYANGMIFFSAKIMAAWNNAIFDSSGPVGNLYDSPEWRFISNVFRQTDAFIFDKTGNGPALSQGKLTPSEYLDYRFDFFNQVWSPDRLGLMMERAALEEGRWLRAVEFLGRENVHGVEDVERALGARIDRSQVPLIPYTDADFETSLKMREREGIEEMLVLFVAAVIDKDGNEIPLTGENINRLVQAQYDKQKLDKFLFSVNQPDCWYVNELFFTQTTLKWEWGLVTKAGLLGSFGKTHEEENQVIQAHREKYGLDPLRVRRPEPFEMLYTIAVHHLNTPGPSLRQGEILLNQTLHWSDISASDGDFVMVGLADSGGAGIYRGSVDDSRGYLGACLSR